MEKKKKKGGLTELNEGIEESDKIISEKDTKIARCPRKNRFK